MKKEIPELEAPMNATERFLHAVAIRLDAIIEQNDKIIQGNSNQSKTPERKAEPKVQAEPEQKEEAKEDTKPAPKKRQPKKRG